MTQLVVTKSGASNGYEIEMRFMDPHGHILGTRISYSGRYLRSIDGVWGVWIVKITLFPGFVKSVYFYKVMSIRCSRWVIEAQTHTGPLCPRNPTSREYRHRVRVMRRLGKTIWSSRSSRSCQEFELHTISLFSNRHWHVHQNGSVSDALTF